MITENVSTLKIHKLTQAQYDRELAAGNIDENALYLTPDEVITPESIGAAGASHTHAITDVGTLDLMLEDITVDLEQHTHDYLPLSGGTLTGALSGTNITVSGSINVPKPSTGGACGAYVDANGKLCTSSGPLSVLHGGTGKSSFTGNSVVIGSNASALSSVTSKSGAFYATATNGAPKFGTLPVAQGGTGSIVAAKDVTLTRGSDSSSSSFGYDCKYIPYLNMCFVRIYAQPNASFDANTEYEIATVSSSTYYPSNMIALSNYAQKEISAYINTEGKVIVRPYESVGTTYGLRLSGFWFCE